MSVGSLEGTCEKWGRLLVLRLFVVSVILCGSEYRESDSSNKNDRHGRSGCGDWIFRIRNVVIHEISEGGRVMEPRTCGNCYWWDKRDETCICPLPMWLMIQKHPMPPEQGAEYCPTWRQRWVEGR